MTCKLPPEDHAAMTRWAENLGESLALGIHAKGGQLGAAREGMAAAVVRGFDRKAAKILALDELFEIDGELLDDRKAGEVLGQ